MAGTANSLFILEQLVVRDFKIRYRNMSLGILWSLLNPLVMVAAYSFVAANVFRNFSIQHYPLFVLCGVICFNYFSVSWIHGTSSITSSAALLKRLSLAREVIPVSTVLANGVHFLLQFGLVLIFTLASGLAITRGLALVAAGCRCTPIVGHRPRPSFQRRGRLCTGHPVCCRIGVPHLVLAYPCVLQ